MTVLRQYEPMLLLNYNLSLGILVSLEDIYLLEQYQFHVDHGYVRTNIGKKMMYLHRLILPTAKVVDHINRNGLDNRRENIRACTQSQNMFNKKQSTLSSSGVRGVHKNGNSWSAVIKIKGKIIHLGTYLTIEEAGIARTRAEIKYGVAQFVN